MRQNRLAIAIGLVLAVSALGGCAGESAYPDLDREQGPDDVLSPDFATEFGDLADKIDVASVRLAALDGETELYVMRTTDDGMCLEVRSEAHGSVFACGNGGAISVGSPAGSYQLRPAPLYEEEGWKILSDNVRTRVAPSAEVDDPADTEPSPRPTGQEMEPWESLPQSVDDSGQRAGASGDVLSAGSDDMTYVVAAGDTASDIAARFGVGLEQLIDEQGKRLGTYPTLAPGDRIQFGTPLTGDDYDCFFGVKEVSPRESCYG